MGTQVRSEGLSRRAYARQRGCSEAAVRKAIADGRLKPALLPDGSIDAHRADELLARTTIAQKETPSELTDARHRKLRAQCALLRDEVQGLEGSLISPAAAKEVMVTTCRHVANKVRGMMEEIVPAVVGIGAPAAAAIVQAITHRTLTELSRTIIVPTAEPTEKRRQRGLASLSGTELDALKTSLQARRLEIEAEQRERALLRLADIGKDVTSRFLSVRTKLLSLHHRTAPQLQLVDEAEARRVLASRIDEAIEALTGSMVSMEDLTDARAAA